MTDLEAIADIITEAAIKAAKKVTEPLETKVQSLGRSIDSHAVMSRSAVEQAQQGLEFARDLHGDVEQSQTALREKLLEVVKRNASAFTALHEKDKDLKSSLDALPVYVRKQIELVQKEYDESFLDIREALVALEQAYENQQKMLEDERASRDAELQEQIKGLADLAEEKIEEIKEQSKGEAGPPGPPGPPGEVGNMVMPTPWAEKRLYKGGETVTHRGGTWYCADSTAEEPGLTPHWTLLANGLDTKSCYEEDGVVNLVYADGSRSQFRVAPRRMGVWKSDERYFKTDLVTYGYSQYRALVDDPTQVPGKKIPNGEAPQWHTEVGRGARGAKGAPGDPQDAAAIVYAQIQKDIADSEVQMAEYLQQVAL